MFGFSAGRWLNEQTSLEPGHNQVNYECDLIVLLKHYRVYKFHKNVQNSKFKRLNILTKMFGSVQNTSREETPFNKFSKLPMHRSLICFPCGVD